MAPKGQKRLSYTEKVLPASKRSKCDQLMQPVIEALEHEDSGLSESSRDMFVAGLGGSLGIASNERHAMQTLVVNMIGDVVKVVETKQKERIDALDTKIVEVEALQSKREAMVVDAKACLSASVAVVDARKAALAESSKIVASARADMSKKQQDQRKVTAAHAVVQEKKDAMVEGITVHMKAIQECDEDANFEGATHFKALSPVLQNLSMDVSLMNTLPNCCKKKPDLRGSFEKLAIDELAKSLAAKASELDQLLTESQATLTESNSAVEAAVAVHDTAAAAQGKASEESVTGLASQREAAATVESANSSLKACVAELEKLTADREIKVAALQSFQACNVSSFENLRDRRSQQVDPIVPTGEVTVDLNEIFLNVENSSADNGLASKTEPVAADINSVTLSIGGA